MSDEFRSNLASRAADLLEGNHIISGDPRERAIQLAELSILVDAVQKMGWQAHTSDWDWSAVITLRDGEQLGSTADNDQDLYGDSLELRLDLERWTACAGDNYKELLNIYMLWKESGDQDEAQEVAIPVNIIESITFYQE